MAGISGHNNILTGLIILLALGATMYNLVYPGSLNSILIYGGGGIAVLWCILYILGHISSHKELKPYIRLSKLALKKVLTDEEMKEAEALSKAIIDSRDKYSWYYIKEYSEGTSTGANRDDKRSELCQKVITSSEKQ